MQRSHEHRSLRPIHDLRRDALDLQSLEPAPAACPDHDEVRVTGARLIEDRGHEVLLSPHHSERASVQLRRDLGQLWGLGSTCSANVQAGQNPVGVDSEQRSHGFDIVQGDKWCLELPSECHSYA